MSKNAAPKSGTDQIHQDPPVAEEESRTYVFLVKNEHSSETFVCSYHEDIADRTYVVAPTRYGMDLGLVLGKLHCEGSCKVKGEVFPIERLASQEDLDTYQKNCEREKEAYTICREKIEKHKLDMKLISAHYLLDEPKVLFFFTADSRVDFRTLVKDLVTVFRMRIELRQIGVRDESRVTGGMAVCGRGLCCNTVTDKLKPVSIKMAKEQNLSLNSMKISGPCGRLLCCLAYEYDFYHEQKRDLPSEGSRISCGDELWRITEVNILSKKIYINSGDGRFIAVPFSYLKRQEDGKWNIDSSFLKE